MQYRCAVGRTLSIPKRTAAGQPAAMASPARAPEGPQTELARHLLALLEKLDERADAEDVHRLRTTVRRLEVHLPAAPKKVARALRHLRKQAGTLRDVDVHLELLKRSPFQSRSNSAARELQAPLRALLNGKRAEEEKLLRRDVAKVRRMLESRLPEAAEDAAQETASAGPGLLRAGQAVAAARARYLHLTEEIPGDANALHKLRIAAKKLRYRLEPLAEFREAEETAAQLKQVQNAIGQWHDWATLLDIADHALPSQRATAAFRALEARTGREFRRARRMALGVKQAIQQAVPQAQAAAQGSIHSMLGRAS